MTSVTAIERGKYIPLEQFEFQESVDQFLRSKLYSETTRRFQMNEYGEKYYWTWEQANAIRRLCEWAGNSAPLYRSIVFGILSHVIGEGGVDWEIELRDKNAPEGAELPAVEYLQEFDEVNDMITLSVDYTAKCISIGEAFILLDRQSPVLRASLLDASFISTNAMGGQSRGRSGITEREYSALVDASRRAMPLGNSGYFGQAPIIPTPDRVSSDYGLILQDGDLDKVLGYRYDDSRSVYIYHADEIIHAKPFLYSSRYPRGVGYPWPVFSEIMEVQNLTAILTRSTSRRSAIAFAVESAPNVLAAEGDSMPTLDMTNNGVSIAQLAPGTKMTYPTDGLNYEGVLALVRQRQREIASSLGLPEYLVTGNMESANRANTEVAERAGTKVLDMYRSLIIQGLRRLYVAAVQHGIDTGQIQGVITDYKITVKGHTTVHQDEAVELEKVQVGLATGIMSRETAMTRLGLDPDMERRRLEEQNAMGMFNTPQNTPPE
jgi:hypothetical protein